MRRGPECRGLMTLQWPIRRWMTAGKPRAPRPPHDVPGHGGAHLKDGVLHITDLYASAVICWFAGQKRFEPEQGHRKRDKKTHKHIHSV